MSCSLLISQCIFYCIGSVMQCLGRCLETYPNVGYVFFDLFFISMSWISTFVLSKILVYISDDFKFKITSVFGSPDFASIQLFVLLRICICLICVHFFLALGALFRIKFFRILHQGLWNFKTFLVTAGFVGLIFVPIKLIQIFLGSLTLILAVNFLVNLFILLKYKRRQKITKCTWVSEIVLNVLLVATIMLTFLSNNSLLPIHARKFICIISGIFLFLNMLRYCRKNLAYHPHNFILQSYCILLLWTGFLLIQEKTHLEKFTIAFSSTIGVMNLIIPMLVVFSRPENDHSIITTDDNSGEDEEQQDFELNDSSEIKKQSKKDKLRKSRIQRNQLQKRKNSRVSLVHFSFMFLVSYFLETFICLENLEENLWKFHSHPYIFFIIASLCIILVIKMTV